METLEPRRVLAAMVQVVHNSPYEAAAVVDVYVNDELLLDDFAFRDASPFVDTPSGVDLKIDLTAADAADNSAPVFSTTVNLEDKRYVVMAVGDPLGTEGQPAFELAVTDVGRVAAESPIRVNTLLFHGSPDAPAVDVVDRAGGTLADDLAYPQFTDSYRSITPRAYTLDVTSSDNSTVVASFTADLSRAGGQAMVVAASGFMSPPTATDPAFGLLAVSPDGTTSLLPAAGPPMARVQVVHNSPYAAASVVDIYANDELFLDDFAYRGATPFIDVAANVDIKVDITAGDAADNSAPVFSTVVNLQSKTYVAMAIGDPSGSPDEPAFELALTDIAREQAKNVESPDILLFHGAPDAPSVDVFARGLSRLAGDLAYGEFGSKYQILPPGNYTLDVNEAGTSNSVASFTADLRGRGGEALIVAATGFAEADTVTDQVFGLLAISPDGTTTLLPRIGDPPARLQVVHNSPYAAAAVVDVYANDALLIDDFAFRDATPFVDVPSHVPVKIDITAGDAADNSAPVFSTVVNFRNQPYVAMAVGDPSGAADQPAFDLVFANPGRESAVDADEVDALLFHGSPDAGAVDIFVRNMDKLIDDLLYPDFTDDYLSVAPASYTLDITSGNENTIVIASFVADLSNSAGVALVTAASGFLSPLTETDPAFGLLAIFPDGSTLLLPATSVVVPGDSNRDGQFDELDLIQVDQAGKFETGEPATFEEGDWDRNVIFNSRDVVRVFQIGNYVMIQ